MPHRPPKFGLFPLVFCLAACGGGAGESPAPVAGSNQGAGPTPAPPPNTLTLGWSTYFGGILAEQPRGIATDSQGNVYVAGGTQSTSFPSAPIPPTKIGQGGSWDMFVVKIAPSGGVLWTTLIGGPGTDKLFSVKVDSQGYIYVAGQSSAGMPVTAGVFQPNFIGHSPANVGGAVLDAWVGKLTPDGSALVWGSYSGTFYEHRDMDIDSDGDLVVSSGWDPVSGQQAYPTNWFTGNYRSTPYAGKDEVIFKIAGDGSKVLWATYLGGSGDDHGHGSIAVDASDAVIFTSSTDSTNLPTTAGSWDNTFNGGLNDRYVAKLSADGKSLLYLTYFGGSGLEGTGTQMIALDSAGNAFIGGHTQSPDLPVTGGPAFAGAPNDGFIAKISPTGGLLAAVYVGGNGDDLIEGVAAAPDGTVTVVGFVYSTDLQTTSTATQTQPQAAMEAYVQRWSGDLGTLLYSSYFGGSGSDRFRDVTVDSTGIAYAVGMSGSNDFPVSNPAQPTLAGSDDGILVKLVPAPNP